MEPEIERRLVERLKAGDESAFDLVCEAYRHQRSRSCDIAPAWHLDPIEDLVERGPSPFDPTAARELDRRIERGLAAMPASYREVLLLVGVHGPTPTEAAAVCDVTTDALRQRPLRRAAASSRSGPWSRRTTPQAPRSRRCGRSRPSVPCAEPLCCPQT